MGAVQRAKANRSPSDPATVAWVRTLWAVGRVPTRMLAQMSGVSPGSIARMIRAGRPAGPPDRSGAYSRLPWPPEAVEAVLADIAAGRPLGPGNTRSLNETTVTWARERVAEGMTQEAVADAIGVGQSVVSQLVRRRIHRHVPMSGPERQAWTERGYLAEPEAAEPPQETTGRIVGPDGQVFGTIRQAEVATGIDRMTIAKALAKPIDGSWKYETGPRPQHHVLLMGSTVERRRATDGRG